MTDRAWLTRKRTTEEVVMSEMEETGTVEAEPVVADATTPEVAPVAPVAPEPDATAVVDEPVSDPGQSQAEPDGVAEPPAGQDGVATFAPELLAKAERYGLTKDDMGSPEAILLKFAQESDRHLAELGKVAIEQRPGPQAPPPAQMPQPQPQQQPAAQQQLLDVGALAAQLSEEGYDDKLVGLLTQMGNQLNSQQQLLADVEVNNTQQKHVAGQAANQQRAADKVARDAWFNGLPQSHKALLADQTVAQDVGKYRRMLDAGHKAQTGQYMDYGELCERAFALAAQPHLAAIARRDVLDAAKKQSGQRMLRPSAQTRMESDTPLTQAGTIATIAADMKERGFGSSFANVQAEIDALPDSM